MSEQYESEIEQILRDTADKINAFKAQIERKAEESRNQTVVDAIRAEHEGQKAAAMREFEAYKKRVAEREGEGTVAASKANATVEAGAYTRSHFRST
jgi:phage shock protein A